MVKLELSQPPPSTTTGSTVIHLDKSLAKNNIALATSSGVPILPKGLWQRTAETLFVNPADVLLL